MKQLKLIGIGNRAAWQWLAMLCGALWFLIYLNIVPTGDDLSYLSAVEGPDRYCTHWWQYPKWMAAHWLRSNGRLPNLVMPLTVALPVFLRALTIGLSLVLLYTFSIKLSGLRQGWLPILMIAVFTFSFPWWDSFTLIDVWGNYVWTAALIVLFLYRMREATDKAGVWWCLLAFAAGMSHEAASAPIAASFILLWILKKEKPADAQLKLFIWFCAGTLIVFFSPGIWGRFGRHSTPDDPLFILFLKSDLIAGILWTTLLFMLFFEKRQKALKRFFRSEMSVPAWGALFSMCFSLAGGIVGRSGFFASTYALIVIFMFLRKKIPYRESIGGKIISAVIALPVIIQLSGVLCWQLKFGKEMREGYEKYFRSSDGIVTVEWTPDNAAPWWTLNIPRGLPDPDDVYLKYTMTLLHPNHPVPVFIRPGDRLSGSLPANEKIQIYETDFSGEPEIRIFFWTENGKQKVAEEVGDKYYITDRVLDPGDRFN